MDWECEAVFGYVKPLQSELKVREYEVYRSVYCGLCKTLARKFGFPARLTLNYDFVFASLLKMGMGTEKSYLCRERCIIHPLKKRACCRPNASMDDVAAMAMLLMYYKLQDDLQDTGLASRVKAIIQYPIAACGRKRALKEYADVDARLAEYMQEQKQVETEGVSSIDVSSHPSGAMLAFLFERFSDDPSQKRVLNRLGYLIGRWVYIIDAADDLEKDYKKGNYNPFLQDISGKGSALDEKTLSALRQKAGNALNLTMGEIADAYLLLELKGFAPIIQNIIYLGMPYMVRSVIDPKMREMRKNQRKKNFYPADYED